jgi:hypothetical protein
MAEPLTLLNIVDRLDPAVRMARAIEFAARGAGLDADVTAALTELAMRLHDELETLHADLEAQMDAERERQP